MGSKTSSKAKIFLSINLVCSYILLTAAACDDACMSPAPAPAPLITPPEKCPMDALKLGVCANVLGGLVRVVVNPPPTTTAAPCCSLLEGLVDLEVALCLCLAVKANVLGIVDLNIPLSLNLMLNACGRTSPIGFTCA